ncbi:hypothetical protein F4809DRAFT_232740 [Biscogniauxia mediterranea]|nr:hypothetical protein F4809DRAFT_232740 [Biscogniauxia mediterranea]
MTCISRINLGSFAVLFLFSFNIMVFQVIIPRDQPPPPDLIGGLMTLRDMRGFSEPETTIWVFEFTLFFPLPIRLCLFTTLNGGLQWDATRI